jgi:hypothetical protein
MEKLIYSGMEEGGTYQTRSSEFLPIENYEVIISEIESIYNSDGGFQLFEVFGDEKIVIVANDAKLNNNFMSEGDSNMSNILKDNGNSEWMINFFLENWEEMSVHDIIRNIAQPGQIINIQVTDTLYGNSEFDLKT